MRKEKFDLILYGSETLSEGSKPCFRYVAQIRNVEYLSKNQIKEASLFDETKEWLKEMEEDIKKIGGNRGALTRSNYRDTPFDVRFHPDDLKIFQKPIFAKQEDLLSRLKSFKLFELTNSKRLKILQPILQFI